MPQMGESIAEGTLTRWFKKPGEKVKRDEPLFEISTDKVDAEIPAPIDGVLQKILVDEGSTVAVNTVVGLLGDGTEAAPATEAPAKAEPPKDEPKPQAQAAPAPARTYLAMVSLAPSTVVIIVTVSSVSAVPPCCTLAELAVITSVCVPDIAARTWAAVNVPAVPP